MYLCIPKKAAHRVLAAVLCAAAAGGVLLGLGWPRAEAEPAAVAAASYEWGLSFQTENEPPIPNLSAEKLRPFDAFYCGDAEQKRLYLTFDAGYENGNTAPILDALKKHNAPGTFFVVGSYIKENPDLIKRMVAEGHTVGNHTYHHPNMSQKDEASFKKELNDLAALFQETTGTPLPLFYRPPEGKFSDENLTWAQELGYKPFSEPRLCGLETGCTAFAGGRF
ncbi:MAG: polysaccharide deacetylase family protein [Ruthenibacterium lactatiformans]